MPVITAQSSIAGARQSKSAIAPSVAVPTSVT